MTMIGRLLLILLASAFVFVNSETFDDDEIGEYLSKPEPTLDHFKDWMLKHDKSYASDDEFIGKYQVFLDNHNLVEKLNQIYMGRTKFALNAFADMSPEEFKRTMLIDNLRKPFVSPESKYLPPIDSDELPTGFDWRTNGTAVTPVKDQGQAGTCWAFSAVENLEGQYGLKNKKLLRLSTEQITECDGTFSRTDDHSDCGVYGGWPYLAFEYVMRAGGIETEEDYPYCSGTGKCLPCSPPGYNRTECGPPIPYCRLSDSCQAKVDPSKFVPSLKVVDWKRTSTNETDIALQMMNTGPLSVALNAELLQFYYGGIFDPFVCDSTALNHAVLLVGWDVHVSRIFKSKKPYWIVKNSWGTGWGEKGYFRIARGKGKCGINTQVVTAILDSTLSE